MYSSLEMTCVGMGRCRSSHASRSDLRIHPFWACGFGQGRIVFGLGMFIPWEPELSRSRLLLKEAVYTPSAQATSFLRRRGLGSKQVEGRLQKAWSETKDRSTKKLAHPSRRIRQRMSRKVDRCQTISSEGARTTRAGVRLPTPD